MIKGALFVGVFLLLSHFCLKQTDRFSLQAIRSHRPYDPRWEGHALSVDEAKELKEALDLQYTYYGRGGQSYIFFSEGEKYVLKFFRQKVFSPPFYLDILPPIFNRYKAKKRWKKADKLMRDFTSYKYAFDDLQDLTGVIYIHLNPTHHLQKSVILVDKLKIAHPLNLDEYNFVLQRKAAFVYDRINESMTGNRVERAQNGIAQIMQLIVDRCKRGYRDRDPNIQTNCGFIGDKAIKIDVGRFVVNDSMKLQANYGRELKRITRPFKEWIERTHPTLIPFFNEELQKHTQEDQRELLQEGRE